LPIVIAVRTRSRGTSKRLVESAAFGLGYTSVLVWIGSALVGSFGASGAVPYWPTLPHLRTDTAGALAFVVAAATLSISRYLQLRRRSSVTLRSADRPAGVYAVQAVAETATVLCTGVVIYLSLNAVTHPWTLRIHLTHLLSWPSEGTVRVIALGICLVATAVRRYLQTTNGGQAARESTTMWEKTDIAV
jgi:hypothetical protein